MQKSDQAVAQFKVENNIVEAGGGTLNDQELADLNRQLIGARADLADQQAKLRLVRDLRGSEAALESVSDVTNSPMILRLREQVTELERQESELRTLYGDRHPRMVQLRDEKAKVGGGDPRRGRARGAHPGERRARGGEPGGVDRSGRWAG